MSLIDKIKKARESIVKINDVTFTIRRPTDFEAITQLEGTDTKEVISRFVIGWDGVKELDLISGGSPELVPFSTDVFMEWAEDNVDVWPDLVDAITESYRAYRAKKEESLGKQKTG